MSDDADPDATDGPEYDINFREHPEEYERSEERRVGKECRL